MRGRVGSSASGSSLLEQSWNSIVEVREVDLNSNLKSLQGGNKSGSGREKRVRNLDQDSRELSPQQLKNVLNLERAAGMDRNYISNYRDSVRHLEADDSIQYLRLEQEQEQNLQNTAKRKEYSGEFKKMDDDKDDNKDGGINYEENMRYFDDFNRQNQGITKEDSFNPSSSLRNVSQDREVRLESRSKRIDLVIFRILIIISSLL